MKRYYFAYHDVNGIIFPFTWCEEDGHCIGGRPDPIKDSVQEISCTEVCQMLVELEKKYPINLPNVVSPKLDTN